MIRRRRWIQPEFFTSEDVLALPKDARLTFIGLWLYADDYGRERTNAALIKADIWPLDDDITQGVVEEHLLLLADREMIVFYTVGGREYFELTGWTRHQPVHSPSRSFIPPPSASQACHKPENYGGNLSILTSTLARTEGEEERERELERATEGERESTGEGEGDHGRGESGENGKAPGEGVQGGVGGPPSPFCSRHPQGTASACKGCGNARLAFRHWQAVQIADGEEARP